jgi:hypothetical protein
MFFLRIKTNRNGHRRLERPVKFTILTKVDLRDSAKERLEALSVSNRSLAKWKTYYF